MLKLYKIYTKSIGRVVISINTKISNTENLSKALPALPPSN